MNILPWLRNYDRGSLRPDVTAGVTVWALLIPQGLAYSQLAGLPAVHGLYASLGAVALYGIVGTSRHLNVGPEATVATLVATTVGPLAGGDPDLHIALSALLAIATGGILVVGGLLRLGFVTRLLSVPVLTGYIAGSALVIIGGQLDDLFGILVDVEQYHTTVAAVVGGIAETNRWDLGVGLVTIGALFGLKRVAPKVPAYLVVVVLGIAATAIWDLDGRGVTVVGDIEGGLPVPSFGGVDGYQVLSLIAPSLAIALLAYVDSISTVKAVADAEGYEIDPNAEFFGLAASNIGSGVVQGFSVNGSQSRSFTAAQSGARTQLSNWVVAVLVLITLLFMTGPFEVLPKATLAGIVIVVGVGLIDVDRYRVLWKARKSDFAYAMVTLAGVVVVGMLPGVAIAVALSLFDVARRVLTPETGEVVRIPGTDAYAREAYVVGGERIPGLVLYRFDAPLIFANVDKLVDEISELVDDAEPPVEAVLVAAGAITDIDMTAYEALSDFVGKLRERGVKVAIARMAPGLYFQLEQAGPVLDVCDAAYYEVDDGVAAFREGRFAADEGVLDRYGTLDPGAAIDWSEIRYDQQFPESDIEAVRSIGEERIEIAERTDDRRPDD